MILDYIYTFRFPIFVILAIVFFVLWMIKKSKAFKLIFSSFILISIVISVFYLMKPTMYETKVDISSAEKFVNYAEENLDLLLSDAGSHTINDNISVTAEKFTSFDEAYDSVSMNFSLFTKIYGLESEDNELTKFNVDNKTVIATPIAYNDRCVVWLPLTYNEYVSKVYVIVDNCVVTFTNSTIRLISQKNISLFTQ